MNAHKHLFRAVYVMFATAAATTMFPSRAGAWCVYNLSSQWVIAEVYGSGWSQGIAPGDYACHVQSGSNPVSLQIKTYDGSTRDFLCVLSMMPNGYGVVYEEARGWGLPGNLHCESFDHNDVQRDYSTYGLGAQQRYVRFLISGDCQFDNGLLSESAGMNGTALVTNMQMTSMLASDRSIRGIIYAGDLTQNTRPFDEFAWYHNSISGFSRFVFDGLGNHDEAQPTGSQSAACSFNDVHCVDPTYLLGDITNRKRNTVKTNKGTPHYSWDWHDVHFVHLNLYPGNDTTGNADTTLDPHASLDFLTNDLATYVGSSGRPVVLIHHYGFDTAVSIDPNHQWWTDAHRLAYWNAIANYNVAAIFTGHYHMVPSDTGWRIDWSRPANGIGTRASIPTFVSGAALYGVFLDVQLTSDNQIVVGRRDQYGNLLTAECANTGDAKIYVDHSTPPLPGGSLGSPFTSIAQALSAISARHPGCPPNQTISLNAGSYHDRLRINQPAHIVAHGGAARVGAP